MNRGLVVSKNTKGLGDTMHNRRKSHRGKRPSGQGPLTPPRSFHRQIQVILQITTKGAISSRTSIPCYHVAEVSNHALLVEIWETRPALFMMNRSLYI